MSTHNSQNRRWNFLLEVDGLPYRFSSSVLPPIKEISGIPGRFYTDRIGIVNVGGLSGTLDPLGGIAEYGQIDITLASDGRYTDYTDPITIFSTLGFRSASGFALVTEYISSTTTAPMTIKVDRDMSEFSYPRLVHIGQEAFWATGFDDETFEFEISQRAVLNTSPRTHTVRVLQADFPELVTDEVVYWRSRGAILKRAMLHPNGSTGPYEEVMRGFIDISPTLNSDGLSLTVGLVPKIMLLEKESDFIRPIETKFVEGYHLFQSGVGSAVDMYHVKPGNLGPAGSETNVWYGEAHQASPIAEGALYPSNANAYAALFDPSLPERHPRAGSIIPRNYPNQDIINIVDITSADFNGELEVDPADPTFNIAQGSSFTNYDPGEIKRAYIIEPGDPDEILIWPGTEDDGLDGVFGRLNAVFDVETNQGYGGAWKRVKFAYEGLDEDKNLIIADIICEDNTPLQNADIGYPQVLFPGNMLDIIYHDSLDTPYWGNDNATGYDYGESGQAGRLSLWFTTEEAPRLWFDGGTLPPLRIGQTLYMPFGIESTEARSLVGTTNPDAPIYDFFIWYRMRGEFFKKPLTCANAWYQKGETKILVENNIAPGAYVVDMGRTFILPDVKVYFDVTAVEPVVLDKGPRLGDTVYQCTVENVGSRVGGAFIPVSFAFFSKEDQRIFTVGQTGRGEGTRYEITSMAGEENLIRTQIGDPPSTVSEAITALLTDTDKFGFSLEDVDIASISAIPEPQFGTWGLPNIPEEISVIDFLKGLLVMTRSALVMRTDTTGKCRITRIDLSAESSVLATTEIDEGDWAADQVPTFGVDDDIVNQLIIKYNYNPNEDEFLDQATINSFSYQASAGEARSEEILLYPLQSDENFSDTDLVVPAQGIFATFGKPRRTWRGKVSSQQGLFCNLGSVVSVTSRFLKGFGKERGVTNEAGRVIEQNIQLWEEGCELVISYSGAANTGWNVAMEVDSIVNANTLVVKAHVFGDEEHPYTGEDTTDLRNFVTSSVFSGTWSGDVLVMNPYNQDAAGTATISSVNFDTNTITFAGAHGASAGWIIEPASYDDAATFHKALAYMADSAGRLGTESDPGKEYA